MRMKGITCCGDCGYYNWGKHKCNRAKNAGDAKDSFYADCPLPDVVIEQQPRVMTLEEMREMKYEKDPLVYFEGKDDARYENWLFYAEPMTLKNGIVYFVTFGDETGIEPDNNEYGKSWRCWTSRPTGAEREAAPWDQ